MDDEKLVITIGGRRFEAVEQTTFERDLWIMEQVEAAKLREVQLDTTKEPTYASQQLIVHAYRSGRLFLMLAGLLDEIGVPWTPATAEVNAKFFAQITHPAEKDLLQAAIIGVLARFFVSAVASCKTSPNSLPDGEAGATAMPDDTPDESLATLATGIPSSEPLLDMTPTSSIAS